MLGESDTTTTKTRRRRIASSQRSVGVRCWENLSYPATRWSQPMSRFAFALVFSLVFALAPAARAAYIPAAHKREAKDVQWYEKGYRYPQAGWVVLHIEGDPYPRGYQHGRLLAPEIAKYVDALARDRYPKDPDEGWRTVRTLADALFLRKL